MLSLKQLRDEINTPITIWVCRIMFSFLRRFLAASHLFIYVRLLYRRTLEKPRLLSNLVRIEKMGLVSFQRYSVPLSDEYLSQW